MQKLFLLISLLIVSTNTVLAGNNLIVTCNPSSSGTGSCSVSPSDKPLFSETDVKPSYNFYQKLTVVNNSAGDDCALYLKASKKTDPSGLAVVLQNTIYKSNFTLYSQSMSTLLDSADPIYLDTVPRTSTNTYDWKVAMDSAAGNAYQNKNLEFDLSLTFQCGQEPLITGVILNEIMPNPSSGNEWVEFYNQNNFAVTLTNWDIGRSSGGIRNITPPVTIPALGYAIFETTPGFYSDSSGLGRLINQNDTEVDRSDLYTSTSTTLSWSRQSNSTWCQAIPTYNNVNNACYVAPTSTPGPGPTSTPNPSPSCNDATPGTPTNLTYTLVNSTQVLLSWSHAPDPHSSYLIAFGTTPGVYLYGNPNVGNGNSYLVSALTPNARYCFVVRAQNGCSPGAFSNEICLNPTSPVPPAPPEGFTEEVLGAQEEPTPTPTGSIEGTSTGITAGAQTSCCFWIFAAIAFIINLVYFFFSSGVFLPLVISFFAYLLDKFLAPYFCQTACRLPLFSLIFCRFCQFILLWAILSFFIPWILRLFLRPAEE